MPSALATTGMALQSASMAHKSKQLLQRIKRGVRLLKNKFVTIRYPLKNGRPSNRPYSRNMLTIVVIIL